MQFLFEFLPKHPVRNTIHFFQEASKRLIQDNKYFNPSTITVSVNYFKTKFSVVTTYIQFLEGVNETYENSGGSSSKPENKRIDNLQKLRLGCLNPLPPGQKLL